MITRIRRAIAAVLTPVLMAISFGRIDLKLRGGTDSEDDESLRPKICGKIR
jgi:hypothetical protein